MPKPNPIERRLQRLSDQWGRFSEEPDARLLRWVVRADERRMLDTFFALEADERAAEHQDFFVVLETPFDDPLRHGFALSRGWVDEYRRIAPVLTREQLDANWDPPLLVPTRDANDVASLLSTCTSFRDHYALVGHLVLVLNPSKLSDMEQYQHWLRRLALGAPPNVRAIVMEDETSPQAAAVAAEEPVRVVTLSAGLDMPAALEEISRDAGQLDTPGGQYRDLFVKLMNALGGGDLERARGLGEAAIAIATAERWFHVVVPVQMALGSALSAANQHSQAQAAYAAAEAAAETGESEAPPEAQPVCKTLRLQARLGRGLAFVVAREWALAAEVYETSAPLAQALGDQRNQLDCHRLACFCHEQGDAPEQALRAGREGLLVARAMDAETLATSSFTYLGEGLMRLTEDHSRRQHRSQFARELRELSQFAGIPDGRKSPEAPQALVTS